MPDEPDADLVHRTLGACLACVEANLTADWTSSPPDIDMDVAALVAHLAQTGYWYAIDLAARGPDLGAVEPVIDATAEPSALVATLGTGFRLLGDVIRAAPADARGFHPDGQADPSGFAAMACDELLVHTSDVSRALGVSFAPDPELVLPVLHRLFPWASPDPTDPWHELLWANGRISLDDRPRQQRWRWHCAPLDEWDGVAPG